VYKPIEEIIKAQEELVEAPGGFTPRIVPRSMADEPGDGWYTLSGAKPPTGFFKN
jgi:hypothetical protein